MKKFEMPEIQVVSFGEEIMSLTVSANEVNGSVYGTSGSAFTINEGTGTIKSSGKFS